LIADGHLGTGDLQAAVFDGFLAPMRICDPEADSAVVPERLLPCRVQGVEGIPAQALLRRVGEEQGERGARLEKRLPRLPISWSPTYLSMPTQSQLLSSNRLAMVKEVRRCMAAPV